MNAYIKKERKTKVDMAQQQYIYIYYVGNKQ